MSHCCAVAPIENCRESSSGMNLAQVGRLRIGVSSEQIECLWNMGFTWAIIAVMLSVSKTTLWHKCRELGICDGQYTDISDFDLDEVMRDLVTSYPNSGLTIPRGHLRRLGIHVERERAHLSMIHVDPVNVCMRRIRVIRHCTYSVPGPYAF